MLVDRAEAVQRSFTVKLTMLIGRRGAEPPDVSQLKWLYDLAMIAPDGIACEIGVLYGGSLICWAAAREGRGQLIAVDNWTSRPAARPRERFVANAERYGLDVRVLDVNGWEAPVLIGEDVAFCFVDSDHSLAGIGQELPAWTDIIMPGGIIAFHDYGVSNPMVAVKLIVDAWDAIAGWEKLGVVGSTIAFRRPL